MRIVMTHDGRQVDSSSEDWRMETEARSLVKLGPDTQRRALAFIAEKRGPDACGALRDLVRRIEAARAEGRDQTRT